MTTSGNASISLVKDVVVSGGGGGGGGGVECLPTGSRVLTAAGFKAVEDLTSEDVIVTADGRAVPFRLRSFTVTGTEQTAPYLIKKNAFGALPAADVTLSPTHAFQIRKNVWYFPCEVAQKNANVVQYGIGTEVTYYHLELPSYFSDNIVMDGGLIVESYRVKNANHIKNRIFKYSNRLQGMIRFQPIADKKHL